jgi:hypothetical protein
VFDSKPVSFCGAGRPALRWASGCTGGADGVIIVRLPVRLPQVQDANR